MALVLGTNSGFVTVAPTTDPAGSNGTIVSAARVTKDTSPSTAVKITEIGWWCDTASNAANFEVGLYAADGVSLPGEAGTRLFVSATNAKGTTAGWKVVTGLNWTISPSTDYWIGVQLDTTTATNINIATSGGLGYDTITSVTTLPDPFGGGGTLTDVDGMLAFYAVWQAASSSNIKTYNTNVRANIKSIDTNVIANVKSLNTNP